MTPSLRTSGYDESKTRFTMTPAMYTPQLVYPYYKDGRIGYEQLAGIDNQAPHRRDVRNTLNSNAFQYGGPEVSQLVGMASFIRRT